MRQIRQSALRLRIFFIWLIFWVVSTLAIAVAPSLRADKLIGQDQVLPLISSVVSIWLPILSCLGAFWFPTEERTRAYNSIVSVERSFGALMVTCVYLSFVFFMLVNVIYMIDYKDLSAGNPCGQGIGIEDQVASVVRLSLLVSPLALAPINWLTGASKSSAKGGLEVE